MANVFDKKYRPVTVVEHKYGVRVVLDEDGKGIGLSGKLQMSDTLLKD